MEKKNALERNIYAYIIVRRQTRALSHEKRKSDVQTRIIILTLNTLTLCHTKRERESYDGTWARRIGANLVNAISAQDAGLVCAAAATHTTTTIDVCLQPVQGQIVTAGR